MQVPLSKSDAVYFLTGTTTTDPPRRAIEVVRTARRVARRIVGVSFAVLGLVALFLGMVAVVTMQGALADWGLVAQDWGMARRSAALALAASGLLLAGCAAAPELPPPMTYGEAKKQVAEQNLEWWQSMFPDEPMPEVEPIKFRDPEVSDTLVDDCLRAADIPGLTFRADGSWSYSMDGKENEFDRAMFVCSLQYPVDVSDPAMAGLLSEEQLVWIGHYNRDRLVPCLRLLGYSVPEWVGDYREGDGYVAAPYFQIDPFPEDDRERARIVTRCPPPPIGPDLVPAMLGER